MPRFLLVLIALWGCVVVAGTQQRWTFFVDNWFYRDVKKRYGSRFATGYTYLIGAGMIVFGLTVLVASYWWE